MRESRMLRGRLFGWLVARGMVMSLAIAVSAYAVMELVRLLSLAPGKEAVPVFSIPFMVASAAIFLCAAAAMAVVSRRRLPSEESFTA